MAQLTGPRAKRKLIAMKPEVTYGIDVFGGVYVTGDVIPAYGISPVLTLEEIDNPTQTGLLGHFQSIIGIETGQVQFSMALRGKGSAYSGVIKPESDLPLRGCGLSSVFSGGAGTEVITYAPTTTFESMTIYVVQENGQSIKLVGCCGTVEFAMRAGGLVEARFTFTGMIAGVGDLAYVAGTYATTPQYPVLKSAAFQIDTANYAPRIAQLGFNLGNMLNRVPSVNATTGMAGYLITDRNPRITIDPEQDTVANYDWYTKWRNANQADCSWQAGTIQYVRLKFSFARLQTVGQSWGERDGLTSLPTQLLATIQNGNDDFSLVFD